MPIIIYPAIKAHMGTTDYYIVTMPVAEITSRLKLPEDMPGWKDMTIKEKFQRTINYNRVKNEIAPYLISDEDRFFNALVVGVTGEDPYKFEPISKFATVNDGIPALFESSIDQIGILTLKGNGIMVPIDGQHRLAGLQSVIEGRKQGQGRAEMEVSKSRNFDSINEDTITVILFPLDKKKARKIFSKLNRHAIKPSSGEILITDDIDSVAIISRDIANKINKNSGENDLVKYKSNTLSDKDGAFTTLLTIYEANKELLERTIERTKLPRIWIKPETPERHNMWKERCEEMWDHLLSNVEVFKDALQDKTSKGDDRRIEIRGDFLLGKPKGQYCMILAYLKLTKTTLGGKAPKEAIETLNKVRWNIYAKDEQGKSLWDRLLWSGKNIITKKKNVELAADIVAYSCGLNFTEDEVNALREKYADLFPENERENIDLPKLVK